MTVQPEHCCKSNLYNHHPAPDAPIYLSQITVTLLSTGCNYYFEFWQWCADFLGGGGWMGGAVTLIYAAFADFHGISTLIMADFKQPASQLTHQILEKLTVALNEHVQTHSSIQVPLKPLLLCFFSFFFLFLKKSFTT